MAKKLVKIQKGNIVKLVDEKDVADYVAIGYVVVKEHNANPFANYNNNNNK